MPPTSGQREAQMLCKSIMVMIRNFVLYGHPIDEFAMALLQRNHQRATEYAHPVIRREGVVQELTDFVRQHIPAGVFQTHEEIARWIGHGGLTHAPEEQRMLFRMMSPWWRPSQVRRPENMPP